MANNIQTALEDSLYDSLRQIMDHLDRNDVPIIFANQGGLEPHNTYVLINIIDRKRVGRVQESTASPIDGKSINFYTNYYSLCVQISIIGNNSSDVMVDFEDSVFSSRRCIEYWQMHNLGPLSHSESRRIPQLRETTWVESYNIDLYLSFAIQSQEEINWIEHFTFKDMYGFDPTP